MKKHPLIRAIQYLEKHCGPVNTEADHDMIYLVVNNKDLIVSKHRLKRLQLLNIFTEEDLGTIEEDFVEDIAYFIYYT